MKFTISRRVSTDISRISLVLVLPSIKPWERRLLKRSDRAAKMTRWHGVTHELCISKCWVSFHLTNVVGQWIVCDGLLFGYHCLFDVAVWATLDQKIVTWKCCQILLQSLPDRLWRSDGGCFECFLLQLLRGISVEWLEGEVLKSPNANQAIEQLIRHLSSGGDIEWLRARI